MNIRIATGGVEINQALVVVVVGGGNEGVVK
jgi:hypothetical protein